MAASDKEVYGFQLGKVLGRGGFGFVKEATLNDNEYAMKVLIKDESWSALDDQMVRTEIEIMKTLNHPNIIKVFKEIMNGKYPRDDGTEKDCVIIVMELARGGNLFDILYFTDGFNEDVSRTYFKQLISAVGAMHEKNITHRDIKPQNTLLDANFNLKICDFGLSKQTDGASLMSTQAGTRTFQAPEIIMGRKYDKGVDVFAIGVMLFLMLTGGSPPFRCASVEDKWFKCIAAGKPEKFWKKQKKAKDKIAQVAGANAEAATDLFLNMIQYQPTQRFDIEACENHEWTNGTTVEGAELTEIMKQIVNETMEKKRADPNSDVQVSERVRAMGNNLDFTLTPPVADHFVLGYTYYVDSEHPYRAFQAVQTYCTKDNLLELDEIKFDEENFVMNFLVKFADKTQAHFVISCYREVEDGPDLISFNKGNSTFDHQTAANVFLRNLLSGLSSHLGTLHVKQDLARTTYNADVLSDLDNHFNSLDLATN